MVTLDEERAGEPLTQRRRRHHGDVLGGPLISVGDLAAGDFTDDRARVEAFRGPEDGAARIVGENPDVHRRRGEGGDVAPAPRHVQLVNGCGPDACLLPRLPDQPARVRFLVFSPEDGLTHQRVDIRAFLEHER